MVFGQGSGFAPQSAYLLLIARLLGSSESGIFAGAFALTSIPGRHSSTGSGTIFLRHVTAEPETFPPYWGNILAVTMAASVAALRGLAVREPVPAPATS